MGEAKRRKVQQDARANEFVAAAYAPATTTYVLEGGLDGYPHVLDVEEFALAVLTPNAMRPRGWSGVGREAHDGLVARMTDSLADVVAAEVDRDGNVMRTFGEDEEFFPTLEDGIAGTSVPSGEPFTVEASLAGGFRDADGLAIGDVMARLSGTVRLGSDGEALVAADLPLSIQAAVLSNKLIGQALSDDVDLCKATAAHLSHLAALVSHLDISGVEDPLAWLDLNECREHLQSFDGLPYPDLPDVTADEVCSNLVAAIADARPGDPMWSYGPMLGVPDWEWSSRDTSGAGLVFADLDAAFAKAAWSAPFSRPNADAQHLDVGGDSLARLRAHLAGCREVSTSSRGRVYLDDARGFHLALLDDEGHKELVAWPLEATTEIRFDPLMTEGLVDVLRAVSPYGEFEARLADPRARDGLETLDALGLLDAVPQPFPDYPGLTFLHAHRRGLSIADLLASLGDVLERGRADGAFLDETTVEEPHGDEGAEDEPDEEDGEAGDDDGSVVDAEVDDLAGWVTDNAGGLVITIAVDQESKAAAIAACRSAGGKADPALKAMLDGVTDWSDIDPESEIRMLRDAASVGCTLQDLAIVAVGLLDDEEDEA